jgi:Putative prokaryotic signal transducing protein
VRRAVRPLKRIYSSYNRIAVHHFRNVLEAHGIPAVVRNELLSSAMGELPPAECQTELWVPAGEAARALAVLDSPAEGEAWICAACGEQAEPQFTQCWRCGAGRSA